MSEHSRGGFEDIQPLEPVRRRNLADDIADRIRGRIFDGTFRPGEKLPPERELARQLKVNRGSLREALKKLQHLGLIRIRQGDGTRVQDFFRTANVDLIKYLFQESPIDRHRLLGDLMEVRTHTCVLIVKLAADRASREDLEALAADVREMRREPGGVDGKRAIQFDFEFYERLAQMSDNLVLTLMLNTVKPPFRMFTPSFSRLVPTGDGMLETQERIVEAILDRRVEEAQDLARTYLEAGASLFLEHHESMQDEQAGLDPEPAD